MADAVTSQVLIDGARSLVMKFTSVSDGTGEAAVAKVNLANLSPVPAAVKIDAIRYATFGMAVDILWDATTDLVAFTVPADEDGRQDFAGFGGLINNSGAGKTGNILFTTRGHSAGDTYSIILEMKKVGA